MKRRSTAILIVLFLTVAIFFAILFSRYRDGLQASNIRAATVAAEIEATIVATLSQ